MASLVLGAQASARQVAANPGDSPVAVAPVDGVAEVPASEDLAVYIASQSPVIAEAFCIQNYNHLAIFKLASSAIVQGVQIDGSSDLGDLTWTSIHVSEYDFSELAVSNPSRAALLSSGAIAAFVVGELKGGCASVPCLAIAFDVPSSDASVTYHWVMPIAPATQETYDAAVMSSGLIAPVAANSGPCTPGGSDTFCNDTLRQRTSTALSAFVGCTKGMVPPVAIEAVACFTLCVPYLAGSPIAYAACVAACNIGVVIGTFIDLHVCEEQLKNAMVDARTSYCGCLAFKLQHCPNLAEPDTAGCP